MMGQSKGYVLISWEYVKILSMGGGGAEYGLCSFFLGTCENTQYGGGGRVRAMFLFPGDM